MNRFLKKTLLFILPVLLLLAVMELLLRTIPNDYSYKSKYLRQNSDKIKVLFLGNSHVFFGINPALLKENGFNAAHVSQSLDFDLGILKKYNWDSLKYVVVPVDYFSLFRSLSASVENWRIRNYNIYYHINLYNNLSNHFQITNGNIITGLSRIKSYYINGGSERTCNELGWGAIYNSAKSKDLAITGKVAAIRHSAEPGDTLFFKKNISILTELIEFARQKTIKVIFVTCPAFVTYTSGLRQSQLDSTTAVISSLVNKNRNTEYVSFLNDKDFGNTDFYDGDHLNEKGTAKFTLKIDSLLHQNK